MTVRVSLGARKTYIEAYKVSEQCIDVSAEKCARDLEELEPSGSDEERPI